MHDVSALNRGQPTDRQPRASRSRFVLDVRQSLPAWKQGAVSRPARSRSDWRFRWRSCAAAGISPIELAGELAGVFNGDSLRAVLVQAAPLTLVGLAASLAFRSDFGISASKARWCSVAFLPREFRSTRSARLQRRLFFMAVASAVGGALWCLLGGSSQDADFASMKSSRRFCSITSPKYFLFHLLYGAWQDAKTAFPQSTPFRPFERLHDLGYGINAGLLISILAIVAAAWLIHFSRVGFYMRFISANPNMAKVVGVPIRAMTIWTVVISGACAGLAGFVNVASQEGPADRVLCRRLRVLRRADRVPVAQRSDPRRRRWLSDRRSIYHRPDLQVFYQIPFTMVQLIEAIIVMSVASSEFFIRHRVRWIR